MSVPDEAAGKRLACPKCKTPISAPAAEEEIESEVIEGVALPPQKASAKERRTSRRDRDEEVDDEDDRPRGKSKKIRKRKPKKSGPVLLVIGLVAVVGLIGGGALWYIGRGKPGKSGDPSQSESAAENSPKVTLPKPSGPAAETAPVPGDWVAFAPPDSGFEARIPASKRLWEYTNPMIGYMDSFDKVVVAAGSSYDVDVGDAHFTVRVIHFLPGKSLEVRLAGMERYFPRIAGKDETSTPWKKIEWLGYDANERQLARPKITQSIERWFLTENAAYVVRVKAYKEEKLKQHAAPFFTSFKPSGGPVEELGRLWFTSTSTAGGVRAKFPGRARAEEKWPSFDLQEGKGGAVFSAYCTDPQGDGEFHDYYVAGVHRYNADWDPPLRARSREGLLKFNFFSGSVRDRTIMDGAPVTVGNRTWQERRGTPAPGVKVSHIVARWYEAGDELYFVAVKRHGGFPPANVLDKFTASLEPLK